MVAEGSSPILPAQMAASQKCACVHIHTGGISQSSVASRSCLRDDAGPRNTRDVLQPRNPFVFKSDNVWQKHFRSSGLLSVGGFPRAFWWPGLFSPREIDMVG